MVSKLKYFLDTTFLESDKTATTVADPSLKSDSQRLSKSSTFEKLEPNNQNAECPSDLNICTEANKMLTPEHKVNDDYTVILREHKSEHHGHSHKHGHVHAAPKDFSSVAWMVIMGDGQVYFYKKIFKNNLSFFFLFLTNL